MRARLIQIGNSRGLRLPKLMIQQAGLGDEVELLAQYNSILIQGVREPRAGWGEAAQQLAERGEDALLDAPSATLFEEEDWQW